MQTVCPQQSPHVCPPGLPLITMSVHVQSLSHIQLFVTPWTLAHQAPLSMGFPRQEYWCGLSFPSLGDLPNPGIEPASPVLPGATWEAHIYKIRIDHLSFIWILKSTADAL